MALDIGSACAGHMTKGILRSMRYPYPDFDRRERVVIAVRNVPGDTIIEAVTVSRSRTSGSLSQFSVMIPSGTPELLPGGCRAEQPIVDPNFHLRDGGLQDRHARGPVAASVRTLAKPAGNSMPC
jgi:hypothetical protein